MGHAYLLLIPKSIFLDFYVYNKHSFRNGFFFTASAMIIAFQIIRYTELGRTSSKGYGQYVNWASPHAPMKVRYPKTENIVARQTKLAAQTQK